MPDELDLRDLRYFEAIADAGHVGRAARLQHRSQPTLTGAVRRLESKLGTTLFERAGRGIRLTAAGEALHSRARTLRSKRFRYRHLTATFTWQRAGRVGRCSRRSREQPAKSFGGLTWRAWVLRPQQWISIWRGRS